MYSSFYNLSEKPFQIDTDPRFLWLGEKHQEALANLKYGLVDRNGLVVLTGDIGTGKTTLVNALLESLDDKVRVAKIDHSSLDPDEFLRLIAKTFDPGLMISGKSDLLLFFNNFLKEAHADGNNVLLIVDEAHRLSPAVMEEIRLLSNIEQAGKSLLSIIFVGQNELIPILRSPQCRALRQRITQFYAIETLTGEETALYVQHRLRISGAERPLFSPAAITEIHAQTKGYPRKINVLCDRALLTGYVKGAYLVDEGIVTECAGEVDLLRKRSTPLFGTQVTRMRNFGLFLLGRAAKAGAKIESGAKTIAGHLRNRYSRWHSKGSIFAQSVLSYSGKFMAHHWRTIVMGLATSAASFIFAAGIIRTLSLADAREPSIVSKLPQTAVAESAPVFGDQAQKAADPHRDRARMIAAESTSPASKPKALPEATTSAEKTLMDPDAALVPNAFGPVQATSQEQADTAPAEDNFKRRVKPVVADRDRGSQGRERITGHYPRTLRGDTREFMATLPADAEQLLPKAKPSIFNHKVRWPQETLYSIALWYTGSGENWEQIAAANPSIAPDRIHIDDTIAIPLPLIKTREPMPSGFLKSRNTAQVVAARIQEGTS